MKESFIQFWRMILKGIAVSVMLTVILCLVFGGWVLLLLVALWASPLLMIPVILFVLYFYYWMFGNDGIKYTAFLEKMDKWSD